MLSCLPVWIPCSHGNLHAQSRLLRVQRFIQWAYPVIRSIDRRDSRAKTKRACKEARDICSKGFTAELDEGSVTKIRFLGTAAGEGWPGLFCECEVCQRARAFGGKNTRTRCSLHIDDEYKVDLPPDNYLHVLRYNLNLAIVKHLFVTHSHYDHFHLDDLLMRRKPFAYLRNEEPLYVYGNKKVVGSIEAIMGSAPGLDLRPQLLKLFSPMKAGKFVVTPLQADHSKIETCLLFLFEADGKTIFHGYDTGWFPRETWKFLENHTLDMAILDCTWGGIPEMKYHMSVDYVLKAKEWMLSKGIADKDTIFVATHFSHNGALLHEDLVSKLQPKNVQVAFDGLEIQL